MIGRSTIKAIYLFRGMIEQYRTNKKDFHLVLIDLKKKHEGASKENL